MTTFHIAFMLLCIAFVAGCATGGATHYGAEKRAVLLKTEPEGCEIYVVPNQIWMNIGDQSSWMNALTPADGDYYRGRSPLILKLEAEEYIFIARHRATPTMMRFMPFVPGRDPSPTIDFGLSNVQSQ